MTDRLEINPSINPQTGVQRATQDDAAFEGETLVEGTVQPLLDGARALKARGLTGPLEMSDAVRPFPRMRSTVAAAAGLTVVEGEKPPKFRPWQPAPDFKTVFSVSGAAQDGDPDDGQ